MARRIEVSTNPIQSILVSKEQEDVKVKLILLELYKILKRFGFDPYTKHYEGPSQSFTNAFDFSELSPEIREEARRVVDELIKVISWDKDGTVSVGGKPIRHSNIYEVVNYLLRRNTERKPPYFHKFSKLLRLISLPKLPPREDRSANFAWSSYGQI